MFLLGMFTLALPHPERAEGTTNMKIRRAGPGEYSIARKESSDPSRWPAGIANYLWILGGWDGIGGSSPGGFQTGSDGLRGEPKGETRCHCGKHQLDGRGC